MEWLIEGSSFFGGCLSLYEELFWGSELREVLEFGSGGSEVLVEMC